MLDHPSNPQAPHAKDAPRYAAYFSPSPGSDWWQAGSAWLGRCAATGQPLAHPEVPGLSAEVLARLTATPARYGWHATLKAPFTLADGVGLDGLQQRLATVCARLPAFTLPPLRVNRLGDFLALAPVQASDTLQGAADALVMELHPMAAPLPPQELARRRAGGLSPRQEVLLQAWGYPHVMDEFRFHFSLTGCLHTETPATCEAVALAAQTWFGALPPCPFAAVSLFEEPGRGQPMRWLGEWPLLGAGARS